MNKKISVEKEVQTYQHQQKRLNNPPAGLSKYDTDTSSTEYRYDVHLDPQLVWSGKEEKSVFDVSLLSLHVHETINPYKVLKTAKKAHGFQYQTTLFDVEGPITRRENLEFYKHKKNWSNRLIAGDSLIVMNSLLKKEGMAGKVQMIYVDPPYGIKYGSNFQPFVNKSDVKDKTDSDLTQEPEMVKAYRDTWELGIHSYLSYLHERLLLCKELLSEEGSIFVQISDENLHYVRCMCEEIFGRENFVSIISYTSTSGFSTNLLSRQGDYIVWFARNKLSLKFRRLFLSKNFGREGGSLYNRIELSDGTRMTIAQYEKESGKRFDYEMRPPGSKVYGLDNLISEGGGRFRSAI